MNAFKASPPGSPDGTLPFFLSYARLGPEALRAPRTAGIAPGSDEVGRFFLRLAERVAEHIGGDPTAMGFYDRQVTYPSDVRDALATALGRAQVFVPLYSPGYLDYSWTRRELAAYTERLRRQSADLRRHILPLLWTPIPPWRGNPEEREAIDRARTLDVVTPQYAAEGLRALTVLSFYPDAFAEVVERVAALVVDAVRRDPIPETGPLTLDELPDVPASDPMFLITFIEPAESSAPEGSPWYRTGAGGRPHVVEHALRIAERLGFAAGTIPVEQAATASASDPVVVLVDPTLLEEGLGSERLVNLVAALPPWVHALVVAGGPESVALAKRTGALLTPRSSPSGPGARRVHLVLAGKDLDRVLPTALATARRSFLRQAPFPGLSPSKPRYRLLPDADDTTGGERRGDR